MEQQNVKRVPYSISDFVKLRDQNNYYVDKTMYLPQLEDEAVNLFFIRPRRFGKSVFISMLQAYLLWHAHHPGYPRRQTHPGHPE